MSVIELQVSDAQKDANLVIHFEEGWSRLRSGHSEREVFAYSVKSDSGKTYECEIFLSDLKTICAFCACAASELGQRKCRHVKAVLADVLQRNPEFALQH
jgi:hypothetical protein